MADYGTRDDAAMDARRSLRDVARARVDQLKNDAFRKLFALSDDSPSSFYAKMCARAKWPDVSAEAAALASRACFPEALSDEEAVYRAAALLASPEPDQEDAARSKRARLSGGFSSGPVLGAVYAYELAGALCDALTERIEAKEVEQATTEKKEEGDEEEDDQEEEEDPEEEEKEEEEEEEEEGDDQADEDDEEKRDFLVDRLIDAGLGAFVRTALVQIKTGRYNSTRLQAASSYLNKDI